MKTWNQTLKAAALGGMIVAAAAACGRADAQPDAGTAAAAPAPPVVTFTAHDFAFAGPDAVPAGVTTFRMVNAGQTLHHLQMVKLDEGKTIDDFFAAMKAGGPPPAWVREVGGPNAPDPGAESNATLTLEPGNYLLLCFVDIPGGVPHVMKGMVKALRVTAPASSPAAAEPTADVVMTLDDYAFGLSTPLTAGRRTIRVENAAAQPHEVELVKLAPGKTTQDLMAWMQQGMEGPPPASAVGGVAGLASGLSNTFTVDVTPGEYVLICFVPDAKDGKPHFMHGMVQTVTVS